MIELFDDFREILVELHRADARFVVLGAHAVAFHGHPRATKDLDIFVEAESSNAQRVYAALAAFGAPLAAFEVGAEDFASYDGVLQIGRGAFIKNKRAAARPQDIADVKALGDE